MEGIEGDYTKGGYGWNFAGLLFRNLLWNLAFDGLIWMRILENCSIICSADDTLLIVETEDTLAACYETNCFVKRVVHKISDLGLSIVEKTEAILFGG